MIITIKNVDESFLSAFRGLAKSAKAKISIKKSKAQQWYSEANKALSDYEKGKIKGYSSADEILKDILDD